LYLWAAKSGAQINNAMVKLLARGHSWHRKLFDGTYASIEDMAKPENIITTGF